MRGIVPGVVGLFGFGSGRKGRMLVSLLLIRGKNPVDNGASGRVYPSKEQLKIIWPFWFVYFFHLLLQPTVSLY